MKLYLIDFIDVHTRMLILSVNRLGQTLCTDIGAFFKLAFLAIAWLMHRKPCEFPTFQLSSLSSAESLGIFVDF